MQNSFVLDEEAMILLEAFEGQDGVVGFDGIVGYLDGSVDRYLWPEYSVVLVFQIIIYVIHTVGIDHRVDERVGEVEAVAMCSQESIHRGLALARSCGVCGVVAWEHREPNHLVFWV